MGLKCPCLIMAIRKRFFFIRNFNITIKDSGTLELAAKAQYIYSLVCGEVLHQFDLMSADVESTNPLTVESIISGLGE